MAHGFASVLTLIAMAAAFHAAPAQVPCPILTDLNQHPEPRSSGIKPQSRNFFAPTQDERFARVGNKFFFTAEDPTHGRELWVTELGGATRMVLDLNPGPDDSSPLRLTSARFSFGERLVFLAGRSTLGLWISDGTASGTTLLTTLPRSTPFHGFAVLGQRLVYGLDEPWITDGTAAGTVMLKDIWPGTDRSRPSVFTTDSSGKNVYFSADDGVHGVELWRTDGTTAGTVMVKDLNPGAASSGPSTLTGTNGLMFFTAVGGLWVSDGTAAGSKILTSANGLKLYGETAVGGSIHFVAYDTNAGNEVWETDGTVAGTKVAVDLVPGTWSSFPKHLYSDGTQLYFVARQDTNRGFEPFALKNGVATPIRPSSTLKSADRFISLGGGITLFRGFTSQSGGELWSTDGTAANTRMIADIHSGAESGNPEYLSATPGGSLTVFVATDATHGRELWITAGVPGTTLLLADLYPSVGTGDGLGRGAVSVIGGDRLFFSANDGTHGFEPHVLSPGGTTHSLGDLNPGPDGSDALGFTSVFNGREEVILFSADDGTNGKELWRTDGTAAGTRLVLDINPGPNDSYPFYFTTVGNTCYFAARDPMHGTELWRTDGTAAGTKRLTDVFAGTGSSIFRIISFQGRLVFSGWNGTTRRLYTSDGTTAGTRPFGSSTFDGMGPMVASDSQIFLLARTQATGTEPHTVDANGNATLIRDIFPGRISSSFNIYGVSNGRAFMRVRDANGDIGIWATDGTSAGTVAIGQDERLVACGRDRAYFTTLRTASTYVSDGTTAGTRRIDRAAAALVPVGTGCYYALSHLDRLTIHRTDGVSPTTRISCTVRENDHGTYVSPNWIRVVGSDVVFDGVHPRLGRELHRIPYFAVAHRTLIGGACGSSPATLRSGVPALRATFPLTVNRAPAGAGLLLVGIPSSPMPLPGSARCGLYMHMATAMIAGSSRASNWTIQATVPNQAGLIGGILNAQAVFLVPTPAFAETSNAVQLQIGQ